MMNEPAKLNVCLILNKRLINYFLGGCGQLINNRIQPVVPEAKEDKWKETTYCRLSFGTGKVPLFS